MWEDGQTYRTGDCNTLHPYQRQSNNNYCKCELVNYNMYNMHTLHSMIMWWCKSIINRQRIVVILLQVYNWATSQIGKCPALCNTTFSFHSTSLIFQRSGLGWVCWKSSEMMEHTFTGCLPFLLPNQSMEGNSWHWTISKLNEVTMFVLCRLVLCSYMYVHNLLN